VQLSGRTAFQQRRCRQRISPRWVADSAASNTICLICLFLSRSLGGPLRMLISTGDATAAINALLADASTDPSARVAANPGARASVISPLGYPGNAEGAHHDLARSLFNNTEVQGEDDIPSQHMCP
jgi:hypothetical protein